MTNENLYREQYENAINSQSLTIELITPETAREYLKFNVINRPLHWPTVLYYVEQMKKGQWRTNGEAICFAKGGALVNGQHRLNAVIAAEIAIPFAVVRNCDDDSFHTYDSGRNRSVADVLALSGVEGYVVISSIISRYNLLKNNLSAVDGNHRVVSAKHATKFSRKDVIDEYLSSSELYQDVRKYALRLNDKKALLKTSEIGGLIIYLIKSKHYKFEFVQDFFDMLFEKKECNHPTIKLLRDKIINDKMSGTSKMTSAYKSALVAKTWNSYATGKILKSLVYNFEREGKILFI